MLSTPLCVQLPYISLLLLDTAPPVLLGVLERSLVGLGLALAEEAVSSLEGPLEIASGGLSKDMNLHQVRFKSALERDDRLDQKGVGVVEVQVHHGHHTNAHKLALDELTELTLVVVHVGGRDRAGLLAASERSGLDVLQCGKVFRQEKLVNYRPGVSRF